MFIATTRGLARGISSMREKASAVSIMTRNLVWPAVMPLGFIGTVADFSDWEKFRVMVRRARRFGFDGAGCIHPGQVKIVNEEYTPSAEEVAYARKVIQMDQEAAAAGRGSFQIDGKMIDIPVVVRAERLLRRYEAIKAREAKTLAAARQ